MIKPQKPQVSPPSREASKADLTIKTDSSVSFNPLPPSQEVEIYERLNPGSLDRLMRMAEREQDGRFVLQQKHLDIEKTRIKSQARAVSRGQWMGLFSVMFVLLFGGYLARLGAYTEAASVVSVIMVGLASVFVIGKTVRLKKEVPPDK